jgi:hypothetical protein
MPKVIIMGGISPKNWSLTAQDGAKEAHSVYKANGSDFVGRDS